MNFSYLIFVRHGDAAVPIDKYPNHETMPLSELGYSQAAALAEDLKDLPISRIYSSPLQRALETAAPLALKKKQTIEKDARLEERVFRPLFEIPYDQLETTINAQNLLAMREGNSDGVNIDGVDDVPTYADRVFQALNEIVLSVRGISVVFSHGGPHEWYVMRLLAKSDEALSRRWLTLGKARCSLFRFSQSSPIPERILGINVPASEARRMIAIDTYP